MGELTNFTVNDDGSVTVGNQLTPEESNILVILKMEKAKGGTFASLRMKKRALEYAESVGIPDFTVEKLFFENYNEDYVKESNLMSVVVFRSIGYVALLGGLICLICCIALLIENFEYYSSFTSCGPDFPILFACGILGILIGVICLPFVRNKYNMGKADKDSIKH